MKVARRVLGELLTDLECKAVQFGGTKDDRGLVWLSRNIAGIPPDCNSPKKPPLRPPCLPGPGHGDLASIDHPRPDEQSGVGIAPELPGQREPSANRAGLRIALRPGQQGIRK